MCRCLLSSFRSHFSVKDDQDNLAFDEVDGLNRQPCGILPYQSIVQNMIHDNLVVIEHSRTYENALLIEMRTEDQTGKQKDGDTDGQIDVSLKIPFRLARVLDTKSRIV